MAPERFVLDNGYGYVFDYNMKALRECIQNITKNRTLLSEKIRIIKNSKEHYFWEGVVGNYQKVLRE